LSPATIFVTKQMLFDSLQTFPASTVFDQVPHYKNLTDNTIMNNLSGIDELIRSFPENTDTLDFDFEELENSLEELMQEVKAADWEPEVKRSIQKDLAQLLDKIAHYEIWGVAAVQEEAINIIGSKITKPKDIEILTQTDLGKRIGTLLSRLGLMVSLLQLPMVAEWYANTYSQPVTEIAKSTEELIKSAKEIDALPNVDDETEYKEELTLQNKEE
ncbi:MAG: hypothetical protein AAF267_24845, partial [Deinococcota bacterium]